MFESISQGLQGALSAITRGGKLSESNIRDGLKSVRQALLEADVEYTVVTDFIERVTEKAVGDRVMKSLRPDQQIVGVVHEELVQLMGPVDHSLHLRRETLNKIMMCGLQGSGKTTTCGKLAKMLSADGWKVLLVAADLQRPGAVDQLKIIGDQIGVPVYFEDPATANPVSVCRNGLKEAKNRGDIRVVIFDTAGRLHVDDELMKELEQIDNKVQPDQVLLVTDAMTGQDAVKSAKSFNDALELDGVILTKLDGDTRGGAALSIKAVTGVPIKFTGVGEQLDRLELFHPDRMAGRILGMGDVVTLFEKAQREFDQDEVLRQQEQLAKGKFTLDDFAKQLKQIKRLGPIKDILNMMGMGQFVEGAAGAEAQNEMTRVEAMLSSMTPDERRNPEKIDRSRRHRIARGSGVEPSDVNGLLKQFDSMSGMVTRMATLGKRDQMKAVQEMMGSGLMNPNGMQIAKQRSKRGPADARLAEEKKKKARKDAKKQRKRNR